MLENPLSFPMFAIVAWLALGTLGLTAARDLRFISRVIFPLGSAIGLALAVGAFLAIGTAPVAAVLPLGLPDLPFHLRLDALGAFFLLLLGAAAPPSRCSPRVTSAQRGDAAGLVCFQYHVFLAAMAFVLLADDAYLFMVAWETMALASYFLVTTEHRIAGDPPRRGSCTC